METVDPAFGINQEASMFLLQKEENRQIRIQNGFEELPGFSRNRRRGDLLGFSTNRATRTTTTPTNRATRILKVARVNGRTMIVTIDKRIRTTRSVITRQNIASGSSRRK
ncbi:Uncharacterized protein Fot_19568 [Forsythia ovata]|uniref:Uncharacterized protein n=1 Tax=Forsythia ovata TaxID=205694 RepID=A0ABD1VLS6_9LAMI